MQGTKIVGSDGKTYTRGKTVCRAYALTPTEEMQVIPLVEELAPGAIEFVNHWLVGPNSVGRSAERILTDDAQAFSALVQQCLNTFGPAMAP